MCLGKGLPSDVGLSCAPRPPPMPREHRAHPAQGRARNQRLLRSLQEGCGDAPALGKCLLRFEVKGFWAVLL